MNFRHLLGCDTIDRTMAYTQFHRIKSGDGVYVRVFSERIIHTTIFCWKVLTHVPPTESDFTIFFKVED